MRLTFLLLLTLIVSACSLNKNAGLPEDYFKQLESWKQDRDVRLRSENSYVNLAGLYWLKSGENSFGSGESNHVVFPEDMPESLGKFVLHEGLVVFVSTPDSLVTIDSVARSNIVVYDPERKVIEAMRHGRYLWHVIERAGNYGIRLRDLEHPKVKEPLNLEYYEWSKDWRIEAEFIQYEQPINITINNIVGFSFDEDIHGELVFEAEGQAHTLFPLLVNEGFFILFADETSGNETYGAGRYMLADRPDESGKVILDFNTAYNPPCAFTDYATCPLPPQENILKIAVEAGEKAWH